MVSLYCQHTDHVYKLSLEADSMLITMKVSGEALLACLLFSSHNRKGAGHSKNGVKLHLESVIT